MKKLYLEWSFIDRVYANTAKEAKVIAKEKYGETYVIDGVKLSKNAPEFNGHFPLEEYDVFGHTRSRLLRFS